MKRGARRKVLGIRRKTQKGTSAGCPLFFQTYSKIVQTILPLTDCVAIGKMTAVAFLSFRA